MDISIMKKKFADTLEIQCLYCKDHEDADFEVKGLVKLLAKLYLIDEATVLDNLDEELCMSLKHKTDSEPNNKITVEIPDKRQHLCINFSNPNNKGLEEEVSIIGPKLRISPEIWTQWCKQTVQQGLEVLRAVFESTDESI